MTGDSAEKAWDRHKSLDDGRWNFDKVSTDSSSTELAELSLRQYVMERMSGFVEQGENIEARQKTWFIFRWLVKVDDDSRSGISLFSILLLKTLGLSEH
jgi:hypothetical protein